jgi:glycyl-tRNA synthetase beta subunit
MAEDECVKANRIALLRAIRDQFARVAKFGEIRGATGTPPTPTP